MVKLAINGYGRIGRVAHIVILERFSKEIDVVAINAGESTDIKGWMNLLKFDTIYGPLKNHNLYIKSPSQNSLSFQTPAKLIGFLGIDDKEIPVFSEKKIENLPWQSLEVDVVIESTGAFKKNEQLEEHIKAGAKSVVLSAPYKDEGSTGTYVLGVNLSQDSQIPEKIISNASCTTNCIAPVAKIIEESLGIEKAMMTTIHAYTSDQRLQDGGHKDYRRARAASQNIIPTSTGATEATASALPSLKNKFHGLAIRVPVTIGSLADITFLVKNNTTVEEVNQILKNATQQENYKNIVAVTTEPIVSSDIIGSSYSSIADLNLTQVVDGNLVKVIAWYDNEFGYANRLVEEALILGKYQKRVSPQA